VIVSINHNLAHKESHMFATFQSTFGDGLLIILIVTAISGVLYRRWFPKNEPGEMAKAGFLDWLKGRMK